MFSAQQMTPIDRDLNKKVVKIIHSLLMNQESAPFRKPVAHKALGLQDYKLIVKRPTDLNLIRRQNNQNKYKFVEEILDEIQLCWDNCKLYNSPDSQIYKQAIFLETAFDALGRQNLPDFWEKIDRNKYNQQFSQRKEQEGSKKIDDVKNKTKKDHLQDSKSKKKGGHVEFIQEPEPQVQHKNNFKIEQQMEAQAPPSPPHFSRQEMDEQAHESQAVDPILVNLMEKPSRQQLIDLGRHLKGVWECEDSNLLSAVLDILHTHQKENMQMSKNGLMSFRIENIHISTYHRIRKVVGLQGDYQKLIE